MKYQKLVCKDCKVEGVKRKISSEYIEDSFNANDEEEFYKYFYDLEDFENSYHHNQYTLENSTDFGVPEYIERYEVICPKCKKYLYISEKDNTPGFKTFDEWYHDENLDQKFVKNN